MDKNEAAIKLACAILKNPNVNVGCSKDYGVSVAIRPTRELSESYKEIISLGTLIKELEKEL